MNSNWEDMLDNDEEFELKKESHHEDEIIEIKKVEPQLVPQPKAKPASQKKAETNDHKPVARELTREEINRKVREDDLKNFAGMFDDNFKVDVNEATLGKEEDFVRFADMIADKIKDCHRKQIVTFMKKLAGNISSSLRVEEITEISNCYIDILNKNSKKTTKKKNEPPSMKKVVGSSKGNAESTLLQNFMDENEDAELNGDEHYHRGKDFDFDFM